jgi:hypothetical protein
MSKIAANINFRYLELIKFNQIQIKFCYLLHGLCSSYLNWSLVFPDVATNLLLTLSKVNYWDTHALHWLSLTSDCEYKTCNLRSALELSRVPPGGT